MPVNKSSNGARQASPIRASPRKASSAATTSRIIPTPLSMSPSHPQGGPSSHSPSTSYSSRFPPAFDANLHHTSSRYSVQQYTPFSPYRPGEYGRSERGLASERTKIERKLFDQDGDQFLVPNGGVRDGGSSPLAPAFEAKMVLRNGASVDLISWLRTNFHHIPSPHTVLTPCMSLIGIRALLLERFPRVPELEELSKTVLAAFPHSQWDYPTGAFSHAEPPTVRGLVWHGKDVAEEEDDEIEEPEKQRPVLPYLNTRARASLGNSGNVRPKGVSSGSRSPTQSTLVSPTSSAARKQVPTTPAKSVLDEFAEIATLAEKTPMSKARSLPAEGSIAAPAYALANICNSFDIAESNRAPKRRFSESPELSRRRATTPDKLQGLLAAAEAVEGSPLHNLLGHKRRRTIGGPGPMLEFSRPSQRKVKLHSQGNISPLLGSFSLLPVHEQHHVDMLVPLNDTYTYDEHTFEPDVDAASTSIPLVPKRAHTASTASQSSLISLTIPSVAGPSTHNRKPNELPTQGEQPGVDCKPPHPYHDMIRQAIEEAPDQRLQLSQIYSSIADRFPFFKTLDEKKTAGWQNSIRHNLSLKKMFVRVNRIDGVPDDTNGKGGWWTVQPGVPDEGRPGRKAKGKKGRGSAADGADGGSIADSDGRRDIKDSETWIGGVDAEAG